MDAFGGGALALAVFSADAALARLRFADALPVFGRVVAAFLGTGARPPHFGLQEFAFGPAVAQLDAGEARLQVADLLRRGTTAGLLRQLLHGLRRLPRQRGGRSL